MAADLKKVKKEEQVLQAAKTSVKKDPVPNLMIGDDADLAFGKDKSFLQRSAGSANLLFNVATFGEAAVIKSGVKSTIRLADKITEKITAKFFTSAAIKDAAEIAGTKAIQKAVQQTSTAVGNETAQEMLSNSPGGLYSKLSIPTTLTDDEVKAANSVNLRMQAEGTSNISPNIAELHTKLENLAEKELLPQFREIDPNLTSGYTGSFKTGTVGNPNKATFGQPINLNKYDIDYYIESDILHEKFGNSLKANPEFRKKLSQTPGFEGLKPNKDGFSIKFKPSNK